MNTSGEHADSVFYGIAAEEIQAGKVDKGLMAKAITKTKGDKKEAEVLYIEWRVDILKLEVAQRLKEDEIDLKAKQKEDQKEKDIYQDYVFLGVLLFVVVIIMLFSALANYIH